jgi:ElaB/YqjD/DUF883 family membrane-anchored ribosome-binding protein
MMPESDKNLPENSQENLDRKLDHAVKETFPTSDPVSVRITKGGAIDYDEHGKPITGDQAQESGGSGSDLIGQAKEVLGTIAAKAPEVVGQAKDTLGDAATTASNLAREAYEQGQRYARQAAERYPETERYYRQGRQAVREYAPENPIWTLLLGAAVGYGIAWMIHHERSRGREGERVPRYTRTRQGYPFAK